MSKIDDLIKKLCPYGVEYKTVGEICETITDYVAAGSFKDIANNVKYLQEPDYAMLVRTTDIKSRFKGDKFVYIDEHAFNYLWRVNLDKESLIIPNIGNCGEVYHLTPDILPYESCALATNAILIRSEKVDIKYLKHVFLATNFQLQLKRITSSSGQTKFNKTDLKKLIVPVPPIEVQEEIVKILDKFGKLEAELEAELETRKSQYEFWRRKLITKDGNRIRLGNICEKITKGTTPTSIGFKFEESGVNFIKIESINNGLFLEDKFAHISEECDSKLGRSKLEENDILFSIAGAIGKVVVVTKDILPANTNQALAIIRFDNSVISPRYLKYCLESPYVKEQYESNAKGSAQTNLSLQNISDFEIYIPTIEEQKRIVNILDKFDKLVNDISVGLPAEIEARRKQYEYYRNKLLSFEEVSCE